MTNERYNARNRIVDLVAWLLILAIINVLIGIVQARAEPGDKYENTVRPRSSPLLAKPAGHSWSPTAQVASGRPYSNCPARAWCGCWMANRFGFSDKSLWQARNWLKIGRELSGPRVGAIAVYRHHVGLITEVTGPNRIMMLSGNDGGAVRERERSTSGIIGYRAL